MSSAHFFGIYRGVVVDNNDPAKHKRLKLRIPSVLDTAVSDWAWPCLPPTENHADHKPHLVAAASTSVGDHGSHTHVITDSNDNFAHSHQSVTPGTVDPITAAPQHTRHKHVPDVGTQVWVMFEGGDQDYPVWVGVTA